MVPDLDAVLQMRPQNTEQRGTTTSLTLLATLLLMEPTIPLAFHVASAHTAGY